VSYNRPLCLRQFYDGADLVGDVGGSLFLFLSVSIAHIILVLRMGGQQLMQKKYI
jgi:hypothetical protein